MLKYRVVYLTLLIASIYWFIFKNESISFAMLLTCIVFPIALKILLIAECRRLRIKIAVKGELRMNQPVQIRVAALGKMHAGIGRISGNVSFQNLISEQKEERSLLLLERGNLLLDDLVYQNAACGIIRVKISGLKACDCFGLTSCKITESRIEAFLLLPDTADGLEDSNKAIPFGDEFIGIRKYREGDHMSGVHWKISSKWDELYVKEFSNPEVSGISTNMLEKCQTCTSRDLCYNR